MERIAAALDLSIGDLLVLTGWINDRQRGVIDVDFDSGPDAAPVTAHANNDGNAVTHDVLIAAMDALAEAKQMMAETAALLDAAERNLEESIKSISRRQHPRGMNLPHLGIVTNGESSATFRG